MSAAHEVGGGMDATHLPADAAAEAHRALQRKWATDYLTRTGNADLLPVLGLVELPPVRRKRRKGTVS